MATRGATTFLICLMSVSCSKAEKDIPEIAIPKDVCAWGEKSWQQEIEDKVDDDSRDHLRGWMLNKIAAGYDGGMTVADAVKEAREKGWSVPKEAKTDMTVYAKKVQEIAGMSMLEYAAVAPRCNGDSKARDAAN